MRRRVLLNGGLRLTTALGALLVADAMAAPQSPVSAAGQQAPEPDTIIVTGKRSDNEIIGDIEPDVTLDQSDIQATGATTIEELVAELEGELSSGRGSGRPVFLLNGRRISGFNELRKIPTEAIEKMEILPEEVALKYGYRPDQRVVNFDLKDNFRALTTELEGGAATEGGRERAEVEANLVRISEDRRWSIDLEYSHEAKLLESERDVAERSAANPYDWRGNIVGLGTNGEIDPGLSALAGEPVTVAGVPANGGEALGDYLATANQLNETDISPYRSLLPEMETLTAGFSYFYPFTDTLSATFSGKIESATNERDSGLATADLTLGAGSAYSPFSQDVALYRYDKALHSETDSLSTEADAILNAEYGFWRWSLEGGYSRSDSETTTGRGLDEESLQARLDAGEASLDPFGDLGDLTFDESESLSETWDTAFFLNGEVMQLPAGPLSGTLQIGASTTSLEASSLRSGVEEDRELSRDNTNIRGSLDIPVSREEDGIFPPVGQLSFNLNGEAQDYSDAGTLGTFGYGATWSPVDKWRLLLSYTDEEKAPGMTQLGNPVVLTPNVRVYDFEAGDTVIVTERQGGNPDLLPEARETWKVGLNFEPISGRERSLNLSADYYDISSRNEASSFPSLTPEIEAAFPERFTRDADGTLTMIDTTPINIAERQQRQIRFGLFYRQQIKPKMPDFPQGPRSGGPGARADGPSPAAKEETAPKPENGESSAPSRGEGNTPPNAERSSEGNSDRSGGGGRRGGPPGGRPMARPGSFSVSASHTYRLEETVLFYEGADELDLLGGSALGASGGVPEHELTTRLGYFNKGVGARLRYTWQSGTTVNAEALGTSSAATGDLHYSDLSTVDLSVFFDPTQRAGLIAKYPWLKGTRISFDLDNVFDEKRDVRDDAGMTPEAYQPDILDPEGRTFAISLRKQFSAE